MPNRFIKESIGTSETLALLTGDEERHFWRLVVQADDFGRFDARPHVIRARAYAAMLKQVDEVESERRTLALETAGLIQLYIVEGRPYGHLTTWEKHQQMRAKVSKFPPPLSDDSTRYQPLSHDNTPSQAIAYAPVLENENENENVLENENEKRQPKRVELFELPDWVDQEVWDAFIEIRRKARPSAAATVKARKLLITALEKLREEGHDPKAVIEQSIRNGWKDVFPLRSNEGNSNRARGATRPPFTNANLATPYSFRSEESHEATIR